MYAQPLLHTLLVTIFIIRLFGANAESQLLLSNLGTKFAVHLITKFPISVIITLTDGTKQSADNVTEAS